MAKLTARQPWRLGGVLVVGILLPGCGGDGGGNGGTPPATTTVAKTSTGSGDAQSGTVGQPLASPLQVVVAEDGQPSAGVGVTWATTVVGGAMTPPSGTTNADGVASSTWTLGTASGAQTAQATVSGASGSPVTFTAAGLAGPATTLADAGGDGQVAEVGAALPLPVQARVTDEHGNGVGGTPVAWAATGASVSEAVVSSNDAGLSQVNVTAGAIAGPIVITATAEGLVGSPVTFDATATPVVPAPASANVTVGNNLFRSNRNDTSNPAVDTVGVNGTVTWTWVNTNSVAHSIESQAAPSFPSSELQAGSGESYSVDFLAPGSYQYTCAVHPGQMTGRIVVR